MLASHYLDAVEAEPDADDVAQIRALACETLEEAGKRAISLALGPEARRHFENAAKLAQDPAVKGRLLREAGNAAHQATDTDGALALFETASQTLGMAQLRREQAVADGLAATVLLEIGRADEAGERLGEPMRRSTTAARTRRSPRWRRSARASSF